MTMSDIFKLMKKHNQDIILKINFFLKASLKPLFDL